MKKLSQEEIIQRFKSIHGDEFDYSQVCYSGLRNKIVIICNKHNQTFMQTPEAHLAGQGCFLCGLDKRKSLVYGVGINDLYEPTRNESYLKWREMLGRCYSPKIQSKHSSYIGCSVCPEWLVYSKFKIWFDNPDNGFQKGYAVDKDILVKGNKTYSPETCIFLPKELNSMFCTKRNARGDLPLGVSKSRSKYRAVARSFGKSYGLGTFDTKEEAFMAYKRFKEQRIKEVATSYYERGDITERAYNAMINYRFEITD